MSNWDGWSIIGCQLAGGALAPARNLDGRIELFGLVVGPYGPELGHTWQISPDGAWSGWSSLGAPPSQFLGSPLAARNADGRLEAFARVGLMSTGSLWHIWQTAPGGAWSAWDDLGGDLGAHTLAVGRNQDGRLEVFVVGAAGSLRHIWQTAPNGGWSEWDDLGAPPGVSLTAGLTVGENLDGRLEVFAAGTDGCLWHIWQGASNGGWDGWSALGAPAGVALAEPAAGRNQDGRLEIFAIGQQAVWHRWQTAPGAAWSAWNSLGAPPGAVSLAGPAVGTNSDGRLELFASNLGQAVWHAWQTSPNVGWSGWNALGGRPGSGPSVAENEDGRLEIFVEDSAGSGLHTGWHRWQVTAGGGWSTGTIEWASSGPAEATSALALNTATGELLAAGETGVWRSQDGGASWTKIGSALLGPSLSIAPGAGTVWATSADGKQILASGNGGQTWTVRCATSGQGHFTSVLADPNTPGTIWAGMTAPDMLAEVLRSTDDGLSWTAVLPASLRGGGGLSPTTAGPLAALSGVAGLLLAGARYYHGGGVLRTADGGGTWALAYDGHFTPLAGASAVAIGGPSAASASAYAGLNVMQFGSLVRSQDGGLTWADVSARLPLRDPSTGGIVANIVPDAAGQNAVYISMWDTAAPERTGVFASSDGGQTWTEVGHLTPRVAGPGGLLLDASSITLYAATGQGVYSYPL